MKKPANQPDFSSKDATGETKPKAGRSSAFARLKRGVWASIFMLMLIDLSAATRVKDIAFIRGARENQLSGMGLVVGLAGDGDKNPSYTIQAVANTLQKYGITVPPTTLAAKNVALVMVTADIPAFVKPGARLDVNVASMGDAASLQGGILLQTPLTGADDQVYAVAQGALSVGGFIGGIGGPGGATSQKNHPTVAQIVAGALVENEIPSTIVRGNRIELLLREPDFTSAARLATAINEYFENSALPIDSTTISVEIPQGLETLPVAFISRIEHIEVSPDTPARIVINERTGTIVANSRIKISNCAIAHGNLTINIASSLRASQPGPFAEAGETVVLPQTETEIHEEPARLIPVPESPTVEMVAESLNALGVTPRDMMAIFQSMKQAGALHAELIIR